MKGCKVSAVRTHIPLFCAVLSAVIALFVACASPAPVAPADADAAKARILDLGWNLSYTEDAAELSALVSGFDFDCKEGLIAYLVAKDGGDAVLLEVLFFQSEADAASAKEMLAEKLSDSATYGRSGSQVWYGTKAAVEKYLE